MPLMNQPTLLLKFSAFLMPFVMAMMSCSTAPHRADSRSASETLPKDTVSVTVMTYNVENLFDSKDDPEKHDETFLPISEKKGAAHQARCKKIQREEWRSQCLNWDWSEEVVRTKLSRLGEVIRSVKDGKGPDLIVFQEVENEGILKRLRDEELNDLGYHSIVLIEGKDVRGIDVAVMSRLPKGSGAKLYEIPFKGMSKKQKEDSRGILETHWRLPDQSTLTVYAVHLPAPFHPASFRKQALIYLDELAQRVPKDHTVLAAGDFNIPVEEDRAQKFAELLENRGWNWAHRGGCYSCLGTSYYPKLKSWSFLDRIAVRNEGPWKMDLESVSVFTTLPEQTDVDGFPASFIPPDQGVSDHLPLILELEAVNE